MIKILSNPLTFEKVLTNAIKTGNREEIIGIMGDIKKLICKNPVDIRLIRQFYLNILNMLFIIEHEVSENPEESSYSMNSLVGQIYRQKTLQEIHVTVENLCLQIAGKIAERRSAKMNQTVEEILDFLNKNYARDIGLEDVAEEVAYTSTYINKMLKTNLQKTFYDLLTDIRMEKARELLRNTDLQIYQIAEQVGYVNVQSFIRMFKKAEGVTPGYYREYRPK